MAKATGHVITIGYDATAGFRIGTFGGSVHAGDAIAYDPQGNIGWISTTGAGGGGFGGDAGVAAQMGYLQETSLLNMEPQGSVPTFNIAAGDGVQGQIGVSLAGDISIGVGTGVGLSTNSSVDYSQVKILACGG